jgi:short-subunit dehydrogenase
MGNTALITGASSGLGKEFARIHAAKGGNLVLIARNKEKLNELKEELELQFKVTVKVIVKDLTEPNAPKEIYEQLKSEGISIQYLINNAGFGGIGKFNERDLQSDLSMINLNIVALTSLTHYFLQDFIKSNEGKILNISSTASLIPGPLQAVYYATKAFVTSFSNAISEELRNGNITVTALLPGPTETQFGRISGMDKTPAFKKTASPKNIALAGYNGMMKGKLNVLAGIPFFMRFLLAFRAFMPLKMILKETRKLQEIK